MKKGDEYTSGYRWNTTTNKTERKTSKASKDGEYTVKTWIGEKLMDYFFVDGKPLGERNPKWLQDDYVKFIRFAQDKIDREEEGIVGIITNHSFLDNPTFRGMRQSLMNSFDQMYFIDLHGNNKKKEKTPDGERDENVFDIEQGVAVSLLIKKKGLEKKIFHTDWWGTREVKYKNGWGEELKKSDLIESKFPFYLFNQKSDQANNEYNSYYQIDEIFKIFSNGIVTKRDSLVISHNSKELINRLKRFADKTLTDEAVSIEFKLPLLDKDKWNLKKARTHLQETGVDENKIVSIHYRPFDNRLIYFDEILVARLVKKVMSNFLFKNYGLVIGRAGQNIGSSTWDLCFISDSSVDLNIFYRGGGMTFPLLINSNEEIQSNFSNQFLLFLKENNIDKDPEKILSYIYAILHSPTYRTKYAEFLKIDFPRISFTENKEIFEQLSALGWQLIQTHLMDKTALETIEDFIHCTDNGNYEVEKPVFNSDKLFINKQQYFYPVSKPVYEFYIGGYQVLDKYLKDRKGRKLTLTETAHVGNIVKVLGFTIKQMKEIDELTKNWI